MARKRTSMKGMGADAFFETPVSQHTSIPAKQLDNKVKEELVKATFYLTQDHIMKLERIRLARKQKGKRIDKSSAFNSSLDACNSVLRDRISIRCACRFYSIVSTLMKIMFVCFSSLTDNFT